MASNNEDSNVNTGIRRVGKQLPDKVDRRTFFKGAVSLSLSGLIAGCTSSDTQTATTTTDTVREPTTTNDESNGGEIMTRNIVWRTPWEASPEYAPSYVASREGFWEAAGASGVEAEVGDGSGDTARRVGTGVNKIGFGNITPQVPGLAEGHEYQIFGTTKARTLLGLHYNAEKLDEPIEDSLEGTTIISESSLTTQSWPIFHQAVGEPNVDFRTANESGAFALFIDGQAGAIWGTINDYQEIANNADFEVGHLPLYNKEPIYGDPHIVNRSWLEEEGNQEFTARLLSGYSQAMKWTLLNPEAAIKHMKEVNSALQAQDDDSLLGQIKAGVAALNLTDEVKENGLGYLDEEILQHSFDRVADVLDVEEVPSAEEVGAWDIQEEAELATLSSDELSQIEEFASPFPDFFE